MHHTITRQQPYAAAVPNADMFLCQVEALTPAGVGGANGAAPMVSHCPVLTSGH